MAIVKNEEQKESGNLLSSQAVRLLCALDLMEFGIEMMRQNIARRNPRFSVDAVNAELQKWICGSSDSNGAVA